MSGHGFDPLADQRAGDTGECDLFLTGTVFLDIIFSGLQRMPACGTEEWADGMASCPGGIANLAIAARRLGLRTSLASAFSDDDYGDFCWRTLADQEQVDLSRARRFEGWHSPVTVSLAVEHDRSMVTHGHPPPVPWSEIVGTPPRTRAAMVELASAEPMGVPGSPTWADLAETDGALLFADVGWDPTGTWSVSVLEELEHCHAFLPNQTEAMAYTRTSTPQDALYALADRVPLAVVTCGPAGAIAIDGSTGEEAQVPALRVSELDPTGSGDVFDAAMVLGTLAGWPLSERLAFAALCSGLSLQQFGGSLAAPGWGDIADWWTSVQRAASTDSYTQSLRRRYEFLDRLTADVPLAATRRATATIARQGDLPGLG